ncbi:ABC transporter permease [Chryseobacterium arachidis]|uniref:ABC transporter permease n=1 Tax=Chryseobacterium arachidis TaxID=1416778 RepID=UPI0036106E16
MIKLLKLEYYKNLNYRPFKIFTILYFAILIALLFIGLVDFDLFGGTINLKEQGIYNFPEIWNFTTWIVGLLKIFLGLIIVFSISQEFSDRMFKQNTIDGLSRKEFIGSKLLTISIFTIVSTVIVFAITMFLGYQYSNTTDSAKVFEEIFFIGNYFVKLFTFFCFLMFLSILLRKSVFVFLAFFVFWIVESILSAMETFVKVKECKDLKEMMSYKMIFLRLIFYPWKVCRA